MNMHFQLKARIFYENGGSPISGSDLGRRIMPAYEDYTPSTNLRSSLGSLLRVNEDFY
jgi:hypothetical protein